MGTNFDVSTQRYLGALKDGATIGDAIDVANLTTHKDAVTAAAIAMLEAEGAIDMKRLATAAGISRASLYRYYPDKLAVEAEIAACLVNRMVAASEGATSIVERLRASVLALIDFPAGAAALGPVVAASEIDVLATSAQVVVGHKAVTPMIVGFAALAATAHRQGRLDDVRIMLNDVIAQFERAQSN